MSLKYRREAYVDLGISSSTYLFTSLLFKVFLVFFRGILIYRTRRMHFKNNAILWENILDFMTTIVLLNEVILFSNNSRIFYILFYATQQGSPYFGEHQLVILKICIKILIEWFFFHHNVKFLYKKCRLEYAPINLSL